jgi:protein-histidine pros-kinase
MQSLSSLESVLAPGLDAALVVDESGTVLLASDQACLVLKYAIGELRGQKLELLIPERFRSVHIGHRLRFTDDRRTRPMGATLALSALCKDGTERRVTVSLNPLSRGLQTLIVATIQVLESECRMLSQS